MTKPDSAVTKSHIAAAARLYGSSERWPDEHVERWIARQLGVELWRNVGVSSPETRRERIGERILELGPETVAGRRAGQPETWGELFARVYGVAL